MVNIAVLGSTGSIGTQTLEIVREQGDIRVCAIAAGHNVKLLERQIREFQPRLAAVWEESDAADLRQRVRELPVRIVSGMDGLIEVAQTEEAELLVTAIVGMIGLRPTIAAIKAKKNIALANKETLVTAGHIIMPLAQENGVKILPVDSEHSAIFQSLNGENGNRINKIFLTASGGPFLGRTKAELENVTVEDALKHPNWSMGPKITVDSATMVNKGLEVIEAKWLFGAGLDQIEVLIQPQSVIHSMVQYEDGSIIAQLGEPDMRLPIQYALYYPKRRPLSGGRLDFFELGNITFQRPDTDTFSGLTLAYEAARRGGNMPAILNAANECAVRMFLDKKISFPQITQILNECMLNCCYIQNPDLDAVLETEKSVYEWIESRW